MQPDLEEFAEIVEGGWPGGDMPGRRPSRDELRRTLQLLLVRQCLFSHTPQAGRSYEIARHYAPFIERYFACLGYRLVVSARSQMAALSVPFDEPRPDAVRQRLRKDETLVLLALRMLWEEAVASRDVDETGVAETTTGDVVDRIKAAAGENPPEEARLAEILRLYQNHGAVRVGDRDRVERVTPLAVTPGIVVLAPDAYLDSLRSWAERPAADAPLEDLEGVGETADEE